ncbi:MAG: hypothetical protein AB2L18_03850 [Anaerolineaceae bacterium]
MRKNNPISTKPAKRKFIEFACLITAFLFSYTLLVHLFNWYTKPLLIKAILLIGLTSFISIVLFFIQRKILEKDYGIYQKLFHHLFIFSFIPLIFLGIYFGFYYEPTPFLTTHQLNIANVSEGFEDENWKPVEITGITFLDGTPVTQSELEFVGEHWIAEDCILLKTSSSIHFEKAFIGAVKISFRSDADQGMVSVLWDGQEQLIDLSTGDEPQVTVPLSASARGSPNLVWRGMAALSIISDFLTILIVILIMAAFFLKNFLSQEESNENSHPVLKFTWVDFFILILLLGISCLLSKNLFGGHFMKYSDLSGDAGNYASFAAAKTYPELFQNDPLLSDVNNFDLFSTYHIYLTKALTPVLGNFGTAFMFLQLPLTFMQLCGFYLLGRELYRSRLFGFLFAALAFIFVQMNLSEFWGYVTSPIPRFSFQAVLPFVLLLVLKHGSNIKRWPFLLAIAAGTIYIHSVSAPVWSIAIILSLWFMAPRSAPTSQKLKYMAVALLVFVVVLSPFVVKYFQKTSFGDQDANSIDKVYAIINYRLAQGMVDFRAATKDFSNIVITSDWLHLTLVGISLFSIIGMNYFSHDPVEKKKVIAVTMWVAGIIGMSIIFPMVDFTIADILKRNPIEIQFLRAMRNFFPLFYILFLWPFAKMYQNSSKLVGKIIPVFLCVGFIILWSSNNKFLETPLISRTMNCWQEGNIICLENDELAVRDEFFKAVNEKTPEGALILSDDLAIRYYSLRPLAFSKKDGATFSFSNHAALLDWYERSLMYDGLWQLRDNWDEFIIAYTDFAYAVDSDYVVIEKAYSLNDFYPADLQLVYSNEEYSLFKLLK